MARIRLMNGIGIEVGQWHSVHSFWMKWPDGLSPKSPHPFGGDSSTTSASISITPVSR